MAKLTRLAQVTCIVFAMAGLLTACGSPAPAAQPTTQPTVDRFANATPAQGAAGPNSPGESSAGGGGGRNPDPNIATLSATTNATSAGVSSASTLNPTAGGTAATLTVVAIGSSAPTGTGQLITPNVRPTTIPGVATAGANTASGGATVGATVGTTVGTTVGATTNATMSATGTSSATMAATSGAMTNATMSATGTSSATMSATMAATGAATSNTSPCPVTLSATGAATSGATAGATMNATVSSSSAATAATAPIPVTGTANAAGGSATPVGAYLGIVGQTVPGCGVLVTAVRLGSAAQVDNLMVGDLIVSIDNQAIQSNEALQAFLTRHAVNDRITITVVRNSQPVQVRVTLMTPPNGTVTAPTQQANATPLGASEPSTPAR